jgi:hypothetical protein
MLIAEIPSRHHDATFSAELLAITAAQPEPLYNAENVTFAAGGRLFATGSKAVYEIDLARAEAASETAHGMASIRAWWTEIPIAVASMPAHYLRNGIAADDTHLYVACASADQSSHPIARLWPPLPEIEQTPPIGSALLFAIVGLCHRRSWLVRARLDKEPLVFDEAMALPGDCFANGIAIDPKSKSLFVADSGSKDILRVELDGGNRLLIPTAVTA